MLEKAYFRICSQNLMHLHIYNLGLFTKVNNGVFPCFTCISLTVNNKIELFKNVTIYLYSFFGEVVIKI